MSEGWCSICVYWLNTHCFIIRLQFPILVLCPFSFLTLVFFFQLRAPMIPNFNYKLYCYCYWFDLSLFNSFCFFLLCSFCSSLVATFLGNFSSLVYHRGVKQGNWCCFVFQSMLSLLWMYWIFLKLASVCYGFFLPWLVFI